MATYDWTGTNIIPNGSGSAVRADLNDALLALFSQNSSATAPPETVAYMTWADTSTGLYKIRNAANSGWITLYQLDGEWTTIALENGTAAAPSLYFKDSGTDTGFYSPGTDQVAITTAGVQRVNFNGATEVVFNDGGADVDFRIEGDTEPNLFKIDAGTDQVQVKNLNGGPLAGTRNRIINGDMRIDQRNDAAAVSINNTVAYTVDRWLCGASGGAGTGTASVQRVVDAPAGFTTSLRYTTTNAKTPAASDHFIVFQPIEGHNINDIAFGTASAQSLTLSFWVKSSLTGTFSGFCRQYSGSSPTVTYRSYVFTYAISAANTWEFKTIAIAADTVFSPNTDAREGLGILFDMGSGSTYETTAGSWQTGNFYRSPSSVRVISTLNATWQVTGVQLEPGTVATPFERRSYGQELALCQRYYEIFGPVAIMLPWSSGTQIVRGQGQFAVTKRTVPSITLGSKIAGTGTASANNVYTNGVEFAASGSQQDVIVYVSNIASAEL